ncbi:hypothetical protein GCM10009117_09080 [Gangjinia marincola]|uniref:Uncharacterized protein n=1 Tax=Gangjinia marincola TaxID=578463 RepID=A0ABP3XU11_9FLAO
MTDFMKDLNQGLNIFKKELMLTTAIINAGNTLILRDLSLENRARKLKDTDL